MLQKIADIRKSLNSGAYQSALALTLTLPNICRQVEYGNTKSGTDGYPYWIDTYVDFSECYIGFGTEEAELNGKICYALRCSFLHCGNDDISSQKVAKNCTINNFELRKPDGIEGTMDMLIVLKIFKMATKKLVQFLMLNTFVH